MLVISQSHLPQNEQTYQTGQCEHRWHVVVDHDSSPGCAGVEL